MTFLSDDMAPEHIESHKLLEDVEALLTLTREVKSVEWNSDETHTIRIVMRTGSVWELDLKYIESQEI